MMAPMLLFVLSIPPTTPRAASYFGGTIVMVGLSKEELVIAADSRNIIQGRPDDSACKIVALGHRLIFTAAGMAGEGDPAHPIWSATDEARRAFGLTQSDSSTDGKTEVVKTAEVWAAAISQDLKSAIKRSPTIITGFFENLILIGIFGGLDRIDQPEFAAVTLTYNRLASQPEEPVIDWTINEYKFTGPGGVVLQPYGDVDVFKEIEAGQTERAKIESVERQRIIDSHDPRAVETITIRAAEKTIAFSTDGKVGGEVDAVSLRASSGVRWIRRKTNCPAN